MLSVMRLRVRGLVVLIVVLCLISLSRFVILRLVLSVVIIR